ncbi:unnamed protein product [Brassica oleracea]
MLCCSFFLGFEEGCTESQKGSQEESFYRQNIWGFTKLNKADFTKLRQEKRVAPTSIFSDSLFLSPTAPCLSISILAMSMVMNPLLLFRATNNYYLIISLMCGFNFGEGRRIERVKKNQRRYATGVTDSCMMCSHEDCYERWNDCVVRKTRRISEQ